MEDEFGVGIIIGGNGGVGVFVGGYGVFVAGDGGPEEAEEDE